MLSLITSKVFIAFAYLGKYETTQNRDGLEMDTRIYSYINDQHTIDPCAVRVSRIGEV